MLVYTNKKIDKILKNYDIVDLCSKVIYANYILFSKYNRVVKKYDKKIKTATQILVNKLKFNIRLENIKIIYLRENMGIAKNGFKLDGLTINYSGDYVIFINHSSLKKNNKILLHEFIHIYVDHFYNYKYVGENAEKIVLRLEGRKL